MTVSESARFHRRNVAPPEKKTKSNNHLYPVILSCCLFLTIVCICLLAALVLIGKHLYQNNSAISEKKYEEIKIKTNENQKMVLARLPNDTRPLHYNLTLNPNIKTGEFHGDVNITIVLSRTKRNVIVHGKKLNIEEVSLLRAHDFEEIEVEHVEENLVDETIIIFSQDDLSPGTYYLNLKFTGTMLNKTVGLYRSHYKNENNTQRAIATSKFEPTYARQAFPCFDEPNMKATYTVHLLKPKDDPSYIALSNMREMISEEVENGMMVHFEESVKMSTYLTCFIVCDFEANEKVILPDTSNIPLKVYATAEQIDKTEFAATIAVGVIEYFISYFQIDYPLPKLDLIAIPDFISGAMEHWGLVTFRETALLYHEDISSTSNMQRVATVVSHELAHSWFGNLVTMNWWNDLWLNEGFASYIQYKGVDAVKKDWQMLNQFLINTLHSVLSLDATSASHPIVQTVLTPDQITEIFDSITYNKGGSILRMLENAVGERIFQKGVTNYLNAHKYGNAVTQDLLDELQKLAPTGLNITDFVNTWIVQMGYPILTVVEEGNKYVLTQKRFLKDPADVGTESSAYGYKWTIPVTYITDKLANPAQVWFKHNEDKLTIDKEAGTKWIKFNHDQVGYYRVNYPKAHWDRLAENIETFSIGDQTHLLEESFSIAESGELSYNVPLDLTKYLDGKTEYIPWSVASTHLRDLKKYLIDSLEYSNYLSYITKISEKAYEKISWEKKPSESHVEKLARVTILGLLCSIDHTDCLKEASTRFNEWLGDTQNKPVSQDLRAIVYKYGMVNAGKQEWEALLEIFKKEIDANEKMNMMSGLAAVKLPWLLQRLIVLGENDDIIRSQDYFSMLQSVSNNPIGTPIVWDYVRTNWEAIVERFTLNDRNLGKLIPGITSSFTTELKLKEMEQFFEEYPDAGAGKAARQQALTNVKNNIKWIKDNKADVEKWIEAQFKQF